LPELFAEYLPGGVVEEVLAVHCARHAMIYCR
jgi:hypothetical protein